MQLRSGYENRRARVELIPMIDVVFLLLVFFIYAMMSMVVHRGLPVELPFASTAQVHKRQAVTLTITKDNELFLEGQPVEMAQIAQRVKERIGPDQDKRVYISGDAKSDLGIVVKVIDRLRQAGISDLTVGTRVPAP